MRSTKKEVDARRYLVEKQFRNGLSVNAISKKLGIGYRLVDHDVKMILESEVPSSEGVPNIPNGYVRLLKGCPQLCGKGEGLVIFHDMLGYPLVRSCSDKHTGPNEVAFMLR